MPFLIRIIVQRLIILGIALLAFLGISPDLSVPTDEENIAAQEERQSIINEILSEQEGEIKDARKYVISIPTEPLAVIDASLLPITQSPSKTPLITIPTIPIKTDLPVPQTPILTETAKKTEETKVIDIEETPESTINNIVFNIVCTNREGTKITISTGSGVLISPNGVVLTNAHVAQLFLLKNYSRENYMDCSLRRENIPTYGYRADILYISKDWIRENTYLVSDPAPRGTGENDYALLVITENTNPVLSLPNQFPYSKINTADGAAKEGDNITASGYPGIQASLLNINSSSRLVIDRTFVDEVYTFARTTIDVFSTGVTNVAARGSSGGGLFENNQLIGIVSTTGNVGNGNYINAITLSYINRDIREETGSSLSSMISGDVRSRADSFNQNDAPVLLQLLARYL